MGLPGRAFCAVLPAFVRVASAFDPTFASVTDALEIFAMKRDAVVGPLAVLQNGQLVSGTDTAFDSIRHGQSYSVTLSSGSGTVRDGT
ncbi:hypothetical protein C8Q73DRAFT_796121 [Cubamyces lactineus]|nr:hypothetical protein C8Q73DRAFT_796121 [Cubamyces lactineus]